MGKHGPQKTPTAILKARGSWRAKARGKEPKRLLGDFSCPTHLKGEARKFWKSTMPDLLEAEIISITDLPAFELVCDCWADYRKVSHALPPDIPLKMRLRQELVKLAAHFGLTPSARAGVKRAPGEMLDEVADRFFRVVK